MLYLFPIVTKHKILLQINKVKMKYNKKENIIIALQGAIKRVKQEFYLALSQEISQNNKVNAYYYCMFHI